MRAFSELAPGDLFSTKSGTWRKIYPRPNTDRRMMPPYNALKLDPPVIAPNVWKNAATQAENGNTTLIDELNQIMVSPVYGTFPAGFLVSDVAEATP